MISTNVIGLLEKMTPEEQEEVEVFAEFLISRRKSKKQKVHTNEIPTQELMRLAEEGRSYNWLASEAQDVYSIEDGEDVEWASKP